MPPVSTFLTLDAPGTWVLEDNGDTTDGFAQLRGPNGAIREIALPTAVMKITSSEPGVTLQIDLAESLGTAKLTVGDLGNSALCPDSIVVDNVISDDTVTLVATGRIIEPSLDEDPKDIIAPRLILSAGTGVGQDGNPMEIQTGVLEVETNTGGIWLENYSNVVIGGLTAAVSGLDVATSGGLFLYNSGSVQLSDTTAPLMVHGGSISGDVRIIAGADITSDVGGAAVNALGGSVSLAAGGDIRLGEAPFTLGSNDILAANNIVLDANGSVHLGGDTDVIANVYGLGTGGSVSVRGGGGITLDGEASVSTLGAGGGNVLLRADPGANVTLNSAGALSVYSLSGGVAVQADSIQISGTSGITAAGGVNLLPASFGRAISLGADADPGNALALSSTELNRVFAPFLGIGNAQSGPVTVDGVLDLAGTANLAIHSLGDISINRDITVSESVTLETAGTVVQSATSHIGTGTLTVFVDRFNENGVGVAPQFLGTRALVSPFVLFGDGDDDTLIGNGVRDKLFGGGGDDYLDGAGGVDLMTGGDGNDTYVVDDADDMIDESNAGGVDTVRSSVGLSLDANIENLVLTGTSNLDGFGNSLDNNLTGNSGSNLLNGLGGADIMRGGLGNDTYYVDDSGDRCLEAVGGGTDTVVSSIAHTLLANIEKLTLVGGANINGAGNALDNEINGTTGNNLLNGLAGADVMSGGLGNDIYIVDNLGDQAFETDAAGGIDTVRSSVSFTLGDNFERLGLTGSGDVDGTGNALANAINGNNGDNRLDGRGGADLMRGGSGDDTYVVDRIGDLTLESSASGGTDTVETAIAFTLSNNVENLVLTGTANVNGAGNALANVLDGNAGSNLLNGFGGADLMRGGGGNDIYIVDNLGDQAVEVSGAGGNDRVQSTVDFTLGSFIETLFLTGSGDIDGTGNGLANVINGNDGKNVLRGQSGADTLRGADGADQLHGGTGKDVLDGGGGADGFYFDTALDAANNVDRIISYSAAEDSIFLENAVFAGLGAGALAASAFHIGPAAADASDRIIYNAATGALYFDADGNGSAASAVQFATLASGLAMTAGEFTVI